MGWVAGSAPASALPADVTSNAGSDVGQRLVGEGVEGDRGRPEFQPVLRAGGCPGREAGEVAVTGGHAGTAGTAGRRTSATSSPGQRRFHQPRVRSALARTAVGLARPMPSTVTM